MIKKILVLLSFLAVVTQPTTVIARAVNTPHVQAELVSRHTALRPGTEAELALRLKIIDHWHTYWQNPGDSGLPTRLNWSLPPDFVAGPIEWPYPKRLPLGPLMNFGYEGEVLHLVRIKVPGNVSTKTPISLAAKADWLVCSDVCIPESADLTLTLPVVTTEPSPDSRWASAFAQANAALPISLPNWQTKANLSGGRLVIDLIPPPSHQHGVENVSFFPSKENLIANAATQTWTKIDAGYRLATTAAEPFDTTKNSVEGVLVASNTWDGAASRALLIAAPISASSAIPVFGKTNNANPLQSPSSTSGDNSTGLWAALLFAFAGGVILNLMPCVFPVLGIKVMSFSRNAQEQPALLRKQGIVFLFGVLVSFWTLAAIILVLRAAGESIGWGFQLQSPVFVTLLAMLFLIMALNLSGLFEMGLRVQTSAASLQSNAPKSPLWDAFLSGVLATVVATPCTAPMMGAALGFTLSQPAHIAMLVFTSIALGMALPVVALSFSPALLKRIPQPGPWMNTFKQLMAFPLFATVAWLAWVLGSQTDNDGIGKLLLGLVGISLAVWLYGHWQTRKPKLGFVLATTIAVMSIAFAWPVERPATSSKAAADAEWEVFSNQKVADLRTQNKGVFIDFTATWCITCQVNKRVALNVDNVRKHFDELQIVRLKADWTLKDPEITSALAAFGRNGVPLYVYYPPKGDVRILPELLTPSIVIEAITNNGGK
jgi:thiol:disulfide interchange protein